MYTNKFVLSVLVNDQPLKELANGVVTIELGANYTLRLRNKNNRRAVAKIWIDGENVSGNGYIINANDFVDIKRHNTKDCAFKFVSLDSSDAMQAGKAGSNDDKVKGVVEVHFHLEKQKIKYPRPVYHYHHHWPWHYNNYPYYMSNNTYGNKQSDWKSTFGISNVRYTSSVNPEPNYATVSNTVNPVPTVPLESLKDGCTVEGATTGQNFSLAFVDHETDYVSLKVFLQGFEPLKSIKDIEAENEMLKRKIAELENQKLKAWLNELGKV